MTPGCMFAAALTLVTGVGPPPPAIQEADTDAVRLYTQALRDLVGEPGAGTFFLAEAILGEGGRTISSEVPEAVAVELAGAGYSVELAHLAESGLWDVPQRQLFLMLGEIDVLQGHKLARLRILVGSGSRLNETVAFTFRKQDDEWVLVERGPPEGG